MYETQERSSGWEVLIALLLLIGLCFAGPTLARSILSDAGVMPAPAHVASMAPASPIYLPRTGDSAGVVAAYAVVDVAWTPTPGPPPPIPTELHWRNTAGQPCSWYASTDRISCEGP